MKKIILLCCSMIFFLSTLSAQNLKETSKQTKALADAIRANNFDLFESNYTVDAVIGIDPVSGLHPLHLACREGNVEIVTFLLKKERSMETGIYVTQEEKPPMIQAMEQGNLEIMQLLLDKGSRDANNTWMGKTYLFHANDLNCTKAVKDLLIQNGANEELARMDAKQVSEVDVINTMAEEFTQELEKNIQFGQYQKIDVYNLNFKIAKMIHGFEEKYPNDAALLADEIVVIMEYRNKKMFKLLDTEQRTVFQSLYPGNYRR